MMMLWSGNEKRPRLSEGAFVSGLPFDIGPSKGAEFKGGGIVMM